MAVKSAGIAEMQALAPLLSIERATTAESAIDFPNPVEAMLSVLPRVESAASPFEWKRDDGHALPRPDGPERRRAGASGALGGTG
jgi:hypothetical protein